MRINRFIQFLGMVMFSTGVFSRVVKSGEVVSLYDFGADEMGYLSLPKQEPVGGILMVPDAFGARKIVQQRCDLMARLGYVVLAVDLYNGFASENEEVARRMQEKVDSQVAVKTLQAAFHMLADSPRYRSGMIIVAVWGDNFKFALKAYEMVERFRPAAMSWLEPEGLQGMEALVGFKMPLQILMSENRKGEQFNALLGRFNGARGMESEVYSYPQGRGFLLDPQSSPEAVDAWSEMIQFWKKVVEHSYHPRAVAGQNPEPSIEQETVSSHDRSPRSRVTRPRTLHPRLR